MYWSLSLNDWDHIANVLTVRISDRAEARKTARPMKMSVGSFATTGAISGRLAVACIAQGLRMAINMTRWNLQIRDCGHA